MEKLQFKDHREIPVADLLALYNDAGWAVYTRDPERLATAVAQSHRVLTAWDGETLVGLIRSISDGQTILYIQDILVRKAYKRRGIGKALFQQLLSHYEGVRQKVLLTDDSPETRGFYEAMGFRSMDQGETVAFMRVDKFVSK